MNLRFAVLLMLILFIMESTVLPWLIPAAWHGRIVPHFVFVMVIYAALYTGRHTALVLGVCFGLVQDIVFYGHLLGVHAFSMGLCGYLTGLLLERKRSPLLTALSVIGLGCLLYDSMVYLIYKAFRFTQESYAFALIESIMPSLFLQIGFALAVYIPARRLFEGAARMAQENEE